MRNYNPLIRVNEKIDAAPANVWDVITYVEWSPASAARSYMLQAIPVRGFVMFLQCLSGFACGSPKPLSARTVRCLANYTHGCPEHSP